MQTLRLLQGGIGGPLRFAERIGLIKALIKLSIHMGRLIPQDCAKRRGIGREATIALVDVVTIGASGGNGSFTRRGNLLGCTLWLAPDAIGCAAAEEALGAKLGFHKRFDRTRHR